MKNFLKTVLSAMKTWVDIKIKDSTADWNQNDSSAINYVKNRPFYEKEGIVYKLDKKYLPEECATLEQVGQVAEMLQVAVEEVQNTTHEVQDIAETAKSTAETAKSTAETAKSTVDSKMDKTNPTGTGSFSMNRKAGTTIGLQSHAEGCNSIASGNYSHAEGYQAEANGNYSHAEGYYTIARYRSQHASGEYNTEEGGHYTTEKSSYSGKLSFSESGQFYGSKTYTIDAETGIFTLISPTRFYAGQLGANPTDYAGYYFIAEYDNAGIWGTELKEDVTSGTALYEIRSDSMANSNFDYYDIRNTNRVRAITDSNVKDIKGKYLYIVGNGTSESERSNAHTLDWDGNAWYQGEVYVGGTAQDDENAVKLAKVTDIPEAIEQWMTENPVQAEVPEALPNPNKLTFTGAVTAEYDGSEEIAIEIPEIPEIPESIPVPETAEVGQTIVVKAVDENGKPTEWECADIDSPDEYITLFHKKFDTNVTNEEAWGGEYFMHGYRHFWVTDLDGNDVQADGLYVRIHVPKQTENIVSSGEVKIYIGKGKPTGWTSWGGNAQPQPYCGFASFVSTSGHETWAKWDYDLRTRTLTGARADNRTLNGNYANGTLNAISFEQAIAKNNWDYWSGVQLDLIAGQLPAGTEILIYARKLNTKKIPDIPKWGV